MVRKNDDNDEMSNAFVGVDPNLRIGNLIPTGIKLKATNLRTSKPTTSGFQLDNSRMEIMAVPDVKVEAIIRLTGGSPKEREHRYNKMVAVDDMYKALEEAQEMLIKIAELTRHIDNAITKAEGKE